MIFIGTKKRIVIDMHGLHAMGNEDIDLHLRYRFIENIIFLRKNEV